MNNPDPLMHIRITDDGYVLHNETGIAAYNKNGAGLFKINGQGLPDNIEVHDQSSKSECSEGTLHIKDGQLFIKDAVLQLPKRKLAMTISGLEEWKGGIVSGTTVIVNILQGDKIIHSEVFSGKATSGFTRQVDVSATSGDLVVVHNRPDLAGLKITAAFVQ